MRTMIGAVVAAMSLMGAPSAWAEKVSIISGIYGPEDLEAMPGGRYVLAAEYFRGSNQRGLALLDTKTDTVTPIPMRFELKAGWGDPACTAPPTRIGPHGISINKRADGKTQVLMVNHNERESMEFVELTGSGKNTRAIWRGCVLTDGQATNDVAAMPDGGFIASVPRDKSAGPRGATPDPTPVKGFVMRWTPGMGLSEAPGTGPTNGVVVSRDGRTMYANAMSAGMRGIRKIDVATGKELGFAPLQFGADNTNWTPDGKLLAAGSRGPEQPPNCVRVDGICSPPFHATLVDPETMAVTPVYAGEAGLNGATTVAVQLGRTVYLGTWNGSRIVKVELDK